MQKRWWLQKAACLSVLLSSPTIFASFLLPTDYLTHVSWHPIMSFTAGAAFNGNAGVSNNFPASSSIFSFFNYAAEHPTQKYALFGAFFGNEFSLKPAWSLQAGVSYYEPSPFVAKGIVTQGVDIPSSNKYNYQYYIESEQLLAEGKLLYNWNIYHPYLSAGIGASFNDAQNFLTNIQPPNTTFSYIYANNTVTSFSYSVGLGVDVDIVEHARLGLGYRFADFGRSQTGNGTIDAIPSNHNFGQSHLYASEFLAQFTFDLA